MSLPPQGGVQREWTVERHRPAGGATGRTRHLPVIDSLARFGGRVMQLGTGRPFGGGRFCFVALKPDAAGL
jgi:hypothetical protein